MNLITCIGALALLGSVLAAPTAEVAACTAQYREYYLNGVAPAFSNPTPGATYKFLQTLPLVPNSTLTIYLNGSPGVEVGPDESQIRFFALLVRQAFYKVVPIDHPHSTDYGNGTTHTDLEITAGALHVIPLPATFLASMNFNYNLKDCTLQTLQGYLTFPTSVGGVPVQIPAITEGFQSLADQAAAMAAKGSAPSL